MKARLSCLLVLCGSFAVSSAQAADLYRGDNWSALASDRNAHKVGDILTVIVYENAAASGTASTGSTKASQLGGRITADNSFNHGGTLGLNSNSTDTGTTGRSGGMVAQISVTVDQMLPNGDLHVSGAQELNINGDKTHIRIAGRVRPADVSNNAVLSSRLADATIDYDGTGFVSNSARPGILTRIINWLGLT